MSMSYILLNNYINQQNFPYFVNQIRLFFFFFMFVYVILSLEVNVLSEVGIDVVCSAKHYDTCLIVLCKF